MTAHIVSLASGASDNLQQHLMRGQQHGLAADLTLLQPLLTLPGYIDGPGNWTGSDSDKSRASVPNIFQVDGPEIEAALKKFSEYELDGDEVNRSRFPLPTSQSQLEQCAFDVHHGSGLCIIRGLDSHKYTVEDGTVIFLGLANYIGNERGLQNSKGDMLSHVTESKSWTVPRARRHGIHTNDSLPFHNDMGCEILAWQVRDQASIGGRTCVASITAIYNDLLQTNPWVLQVLAEPKWPIRSSSKREKPFVLSPLIEFHAGNLLVSMDPARIGPHPLSFDDSIPALTTKQQEALAILQKAAQKHQIRLETQPGDIIFINNLSLLHAREAYNDSATSSRHLVRLWLRNSELGWPIPPSMKMPWDAAFGERAKKVINRYYPIVPMPEYMECKYSNGTAAFVADQDSESDDDNSCEIKN